MPISLFRITWRKLVAGILFLPSLWQTCRPVLDYAGYYDFYVSHAKEPGWLGTMLDWFLNPPQWALGPSIVVGLLLIYWDLRSRQAKLALPSAGLHPKMKNDSKAGVNQASEQNPAWDAIKIEITGCFFQENTPNEVHFGLRVTNPGLPSILRNWRAVVATKIFTYETNLITTLMRNIIGANGSPCGEILPEGRPLEQGSEWQGGAKFTYDGNALARFGTLGNELVIFAEDVRGRQIKSDKFTLSKIFVAPK